MVLDNVTNDSVAVKVSTPPLGSEILFKGYLYVGNVVAVPEGLKYCVGIAHSH